MHRALLLIVPLVVVASAPAQGIHEQYDRFTDRTTVTQALIYDAPLLGPTKQLVVMYLFPGEVQRTPPDSIAFLVIMRSVGTAEISAGGWKLSDDTPLYFLVNDTSRMVVPPLGRDWNTATMGSLGYQLLETMAYGMSRDDFYHLVASDNVEFKVGPWERQLKEKDLKNLRALVSRMELPPPEP